LLGEGIIPATWCAEIFIHNLHDVKSYRESVLKKFEPYALVFKFIQLKITGKFNMIRYVYDLLRIYNYMKKEENRYGMQVKMMDMMKVSKA